MKSDNEVLADVKAALDWDGSVNDRALVVAVKDSIVTLAGSVGTYSDRWGAERITKNVAGVRAVANDIEIKLDAASHRSDTEVAAAALAALKSHVNIPSADIKVIVNSGWVTLEGKVEKWHQMNAAEQAVRPLWGVKGIINSVEIEPVAEAGDIKGKIRASFLRHANLDVDTVKVDVSDKAVTLTGEVASWRERDDAEIAAWSAPGVARVQNMLSVRL